MNKDHEKKPNHGISKKTLRRCEDQMLVWAEPYSGMLKTKESNWEIGLKVSG